ncbi:ArdC family protein [Citrobacter werkmanii]|uniref:ArdC family protein n=1 Tax=Citrobacter werkmanii TaxID=67827 RepID=UPI0026570773|nr:zincin-like metallopeptidase domain-containing protein [Citrobacter werkmanii]MDN8554974.1 zincin-like metallopeptidase domain-containing protein [Citrobacter werkmanii]
MTSSASHTDIYQKITDDIIEALEQGQAPWVRPWRDGEPVFPVNIASGRAYNGINIPLLWRSADKNGYENDRWLTFHQALQAGGNVRKGEKSTFAALYLPKERELRDKDGTQLLNDDGTPQVTQFAIMREFRLFNVAQCEGLPESFFAPVAQILSPLDTAENIKTHSGVTIAHSQQNKAYYYPAQDRIMLPHPAQFPGKEAYYSTLLHELTHATGHHSRLSREGITSPTARFGNAHYAFEELVAEMGSAFLCAHAGIPSRLQHASYIASWLKILREDNKAIIRASGQARQACEWLLKQAAEQPYRLSA